MSAHVDLVVKTADTSDAIGSSFPGRCMVPVVAIAQRSVFKEERKIKSIRKDIVATRDVPELLCQALVNA